MNSSLSSIGFGGFRRLVGAALALFALAFMLWSSAASASGAPPATVVGSWAARANQTTGTLSITSQTGAGTCKAITGTLFGVALQGSYCPGSGEINFAVPGSVQFYEGVVGDVGAVTFMSGHFSQWVGGLGQYNFSAQK